MRLVCTPLTAVIKRPSWILTCSPLADLSRRSFRTSVLPSHKTRPHCAIIRSSTFQAVRRYSVNGKANDRAFVDSEPTIYALSTAPGRAAIAVIRISGPACTDIYQALCPGKKPLKPRYAAVRSLYQPHPAPSPETLLDSSALLLHFTAPRTATGEDILELHVHGGTAVVKAVLAAIPQCTSSPGAIRYAEPGEFTRRAFMNDRLDLTQVEALGDTLSAATEQQRRLSVRGTTSQLSQRYETWRTSLLYARGELEALIDFSEDQHFDESPALLTASVAGQVRELKRLLRAHSQNAVRAELLRNGISISLLGAPNAGKSSLLNRVVGREAAIVSQEAGTTRDVVEVGIDLGGYLCRLGDTAGLRSALSGRDDDLAEHMREKIGVIEKEGMRRAKERAEESDVVIAVLSCERLNGQVTVKLNPEVITTAAKLSADKANVMVVLNKIDLFSDSAVAVQQAVDLVRAALPHVQHENIIPISCTELDLDRSQIGHFLNRLIKRFEEMTSPMSITSDTDPSIWQESLGATERHRLLLDECQLHLQQFLDEAELSKPVDSDELEDGDIDIVLAAESLRAAANCLARITGKGEAGDVEEVLGVVFEK